MSHNPDNPQPDLVEQIIALETTLRAAEERAKDAEANLVGKTNRIKALDKQLEQRWLKTVELEAALKAAKEQRADDIARVWRIYKM